MSVTRVLRFLALALVCASAPLSAADLPSVFPQLRTLFPDAEAYGGFEGTPPSAAVYRAGKVVGYVFLTGDVLRIPAYSGKPINTLVGLDAQGRIVGVAIVQHDEPILAVGITPEQLNRFVAQYEGRSAFDRVTIGAPREGHVAIDGITGATITVMVENATVMRAARIVAESRGIGAAAAAPVAAAPSPAAAQPQTGAPAPEQPRSEAPPPTTRSGAAVGRPPAAPASVAPRAGSGKAASPSSVAAPAVPVRPAADAVVPLARDMPPPNVAPLPAVPGTWIPAQEEPQWVAIWHDRTFEIAVLVVGLTALFSILVFQDWLARHPKLLIYVRNGFHVYTLFFIGWYALAQLSVINVLTFVNAVMHGFRWENFLLDPMLFILWSFVAMTLLLWGRGVYCGWLCPFGALQELILIASRRLKLPQFEFSDVVHERLWAVKYILLIVLFGVSLQSLGEAATYAEVEPFKTVITLRFNREWPFVTYALALIGISAFNRKFFCKYLCALGAALAIPGRFRLFDWWLRRRRECGKPCQVCYNRCSVRAIRPTGEINANECHYCLDCQVIYYNDKVCLPLIERRQKREQRLQRGKIPPIVAAPATGDVSQQAVPTDLRG
jgi:Na+-translocating ferredoxin:NAD+ oxidoreductase RnfG subunit